MVYALADMQLTQPNPSTAYYRGIYGGVSVLIAPDPVNLYTRSIEGRIYALGMIPGRPTDQLTVTMGYNRFSRTAVRSVIASGGSAHRDQFSVGTLYAFHATNGVFVSPSLTYIRNPTLSGAYRPALNLATSVSLLF